MISRKNAAWRALTDRQRKYFRRTGIGVAVTAVVLALLVFALPTPLARWVIASQLESIGVAHGGIDTVDIDLWNSEVRAGPIVFSANDARDGQVGHVGFDYSFGALFKSRAFLQRFFVDGVDVHIARGDDGVMSLNGVRLQPPDAETPGTENETADESGFGIGFERFEFTNGVLVFEDVTGGVLSVAVDTLTIERLFTWTPEAPARFALRGNANDIALSLDGTIVPFGDPLRIEIDSRIDGATIGRVARFVGPSGLAREDGTLNTGTHYAYEIYADGRIEGRATGTYRIAGLDIVSDDGESAALDAATLNLDLLQKINPDGTMALRGGLSLDLTKIAIAGVSGDRIEIGSATLAIADIALDKSAERRTTLVSYERASGAAVSPAGQAVSLIALMIDVVRNLAIDMLSHQLTLDGKPQLRLDDVRVVLAARDDTPAQTLTVDRLDVALGAVDSETVDAGFLGRLGLDATVGTLAFATGDGAIAAETKAVRLQSRAIEFSAYREATDIAFDFEAALDGLAMRQGDDLRASAGTLSLASEGLRLAREGDGGEAEGPIALTLEDIAAAIPGEAGAVTLRGDRARLSLAPLAVTAGTGPALRFGGELVLDGIALERAGDRPVSLSLASHRSDFTDFAMQPDGDDTLVEGGIATEIGALAVTRGSGDDAVRIAVRRIGNTATGLRVTGLRSGEPIVSAANRVDLSGIEAAFPVAGGERGTASLTRLEADLASIRAAAGAVTLNGSVNANGFSVATDGASPDRLDIGSLALTGLDVNGNAGLAADELVIGALDVRLALPLPGAAAGAEPEPAAPAEKSAPPAANESVGDVILATPEPPVRIGRFALAPGARFVVVDESFAPPFETAIVVDRLEIGPVDTQRAETRTVVELAATVNDAATLRAEGWVQPFGRDPQVDATGGVEALNLPFLSPYVAQFTGVNVESGDLAAEVRAATGANGLDGRLDVRVDDLYVAPISEKEAERLKASVGLPVGFAVSVLKNSDGVIDLGFPLSGSLAAPEIDFSEAINKAIGGALASVFPLNWFGKDGNSFSMQAAGFEPATDRLSEEGTAVVRSMGELIAAKPDIRVRVCGRAARDDLLALRGADAEPDAASNIGSKAPEGAPPRPEPVPVEIADPDTKEIEALLALARLRGAAVRHLLAEEFAIDAERLPPCRTTYSIEGGKGPRAEFQF